MKRQNALHEAAACGDHAEILALLHADSDIDRVSNDGKTALHQAALYGKLETVRLLVNQGANVNLHDLFASYTPLHLAAAHANRQIVMEICAILLTAGADVNAQTKWGTTPLWSAAVAGRIELLEFLLSRGAELDVRDTEGRTPLIFIVKHPFHPDMLSFLLTRGIDVNAQDVNGRTALMYAAEAANEKLINILLDNAADLTLRDKNGRNALMYAAGEAPKMSEIGMLGREISTMKEATPRNGMRRKRQYASPELIITGLRQSVCCCDAARYPIHRMRLAEPPWRSHEKMRGTSARIMQKSSRP